MPVNEPGPTATAIAPIEATPPSTSRSTLSTIGPSASAWPCAIGSLSRASAWRDAASKTAAEAAPQDVSIDKIRIETAIPPNSRREKQLSG